jgi:hypothetical protein
MTLRSIAAAVLAVAAGIAATASHAQVPPVENEPTLTTAAFSGLPAATGAGYRLDPGVPVTGYHGQFTLHTDHGDITADGIGLLRQRVAEVGPAAELAKLSSSDVFVDALAKSASNTAAAVGKAVTNPVETAKALPAGVGRFFKSVGSTVESAASKSSGGNTSEAAKDALGINKAKRRIAQRVGVDPYTTNPVVAKRLDDLANAAFAGGVSLDVALAVTTAGVATAISVTKTVSNMAWELPPADIRARNDEGLAAFDIDQATRNALLDNRWYTPTMALSFVEEMKGLGVRKGTSAFTALAARAETETEARFFVAQLRQARAYAKAGNTIAAIEASGRVGEFRTADGKLFVPASLDYLSWTDGVKGFAERDHGAGTREVWLTGKLSPAASKGLAATGWKVRENVPLD